MAVPIRTTWLRTSIWPTCLRNSRPTAAKATRAAVSRALARSRTGRMSSRPYFCIPARSACPGRGLVSRSLRASPSRIDESTGSADITCSHLGHSELATSIAMGPPIVTPCRTPPKIRTTSCSNFIRAPRPTPKRRRARSAPISAVVTCTPAGIPSQTDTSDGPCDSPAVIHLNMSQSSQSRPVTANPVDSRPESGPHLRYRCVHSGHEFHLAHGLP